LGDPLTPSNLNVVGQPPARGACLLAPWLDGLPAGPRDLLAVLPVVDVNGLSLAALEKLDERPRPGVHAALFCADPFLRIRDAVEVLRRAGIGGVTNFPTIQTIDGEAARDLESADLGATREIRMLHQFAQAGFRVLAFAGSAETGAILARQGAEGVILHPGPPSGDWRGRAAAVRQAGQAIRSLRHLTGVSVRLFRPDGFGAELDAAAALADGTVTYG
jgi:predicted TIM-barrel enzyme